MRFFRFFLYFFVSFMLSAGMVFAQEQKPAEQPAVEKKAEAPAPVMTLGALMYMNWHIGLTDTSDKTVSDKARYNKKNTFDFERLYLDLKYQMDEVWSARITTDISDNVMLEDVKDNKQELDSGETVTSKTGTNSSKYRLYVKHAFVQAKKKIDPVDVQVKAGMVDTPIAAYYEGIGDQRWIIESMFGLSSKMLYIYSASAGKPAGYSVDTTADMGVQLQVNYQKLVSLVGAVTNGETFKNAYEYDSGTRSEGKAYTGRLAVMPIEGLAINGFYKMEGTNTEESKYQKGYYGGGVLWVSDMLRAGINYILPYEKKDGKKITDASGEEYDMSVIDAWLSVYLDKVIDVPFIVMARYGMTDNGLDNGKTTMLGGGAGYVFNKYCRVIAWYQQFDNEALDAAKGPNPEKVFSVKAEVKI